MNFNYVVQRQEKAKICFGSGLERKTLEEDTRGLISRHARQHIKENLSIGPGKYEIPPQNSALGPLINKPTSKLGTVLGGRKAERKFFYVSPTTPAPGDYNVPTFPALLQPSCVPFNSTSERTVHIKNVPGVGIYNVAPYKRRTISFKHSFGGKKCLQSSVITKCTPYSFDACERCQQLPEGDYWYLDRVAGEKITKIKKNNQITADGIFLCRPCYEIEKKENKLFSKGQMQNFKKIRDCSKIHFHDGCKGKLFLVPPQEIAKLKEREAYLSLYFK